MDQYQQSGLYQLPAQALQSIHSSSQKSKQNEQSLSTQPTNKIEIMKSKDFSYDQSNQFEGINQEDYEDDVQTIKRKYSVDQQQNCQQVNRDPSYIRDSFSDLNIDTETEYFPLNQSIPISAKYEITLLQKPQKMQNMNKNKQIQNDLFGSCQIQLQFESDEREKEKSPVKIINPQIIKNITTSISEIRRQLKIQFQQKLQKNNQFQIDNSLGDSVYMKPVNPIVVKENPKKDNEIIIVRMGNNFYYKHMHKQIQITFDFMNQLAQQFLKLETLIPLVDQSLFTNCNYIDQFLKSYTQFLKVRKGKDFLNVFQSIQKSKSPKKQKQQSYINFFKEQFFKLYKYSKVQLLKKTLLSKMNSLILLQKIRPPQIQKQIKQLKQQLSKLELCLCFERSVSYCNERQEKHNSLQQNIWRKHKQNINVEWKWFTSNVFDTVSI